MTSRVGVHGAPVLQHGDPVTDLPDLLQPVGDVDDGDALGGEVADHPEEPFDLLVVQHGRRLVHDDQPGVLGQRPGHAHHLLGGRGQLPDLDGGADLRVAQPGHQRRGGAVVLRRPAEPGAGALPAEEHVVGHAEAGDQVELLVDRRDAQRDGRLGIGEPHRLALPGDQPLVGLVGAGQDLDQGRLAGAVLPEQAVHLARPHVEVDPAEGPDAGELLDDAAHLQQCVRRRSGRCGHEGASTFAQH
jgi:hypothetical protein